ncbi:hypothetical protein Ddc_09029 [Ditylenchus destructor]|nr:hypothetical protein Ddc_09029 [Ditylenchus destructor]
MRNVPAIKYVGMKRKVSPQLFAAQSSSQLQTTAPQGEDTSAHSFSDQHLQRTDKYQSFPTNHNVFSRLFHNLHWLSQELSKPTIRMRWKKISDDLENK